MSQGDGLTAVEANILKRGCSAGKLYGVSCDEWPRQRVGLREGSRGITRRRI